MKPTRRTFPIGIQDFEQLRTLNKVYVDKTDLIYQMVSTNQIYFLNRPRRFGKSLLLSTLKAYFQGKKDLFKGLAIEQLETEWEAHPVLHISFAKANYRTVADLERILDKKLSEWETVYGRDEKDKTVSERFDSVITHAYEQIGREVVILIDEYDSPILDSHSQADPKLREALRMLMRQFFSPLKDNTVIIRFLFITGITKFSQLSIFSELNHLNNISLWPQYSSICGITETELFTQFKPDIAALAERYHETYDEACAHLKQLYDGYHFCEDTEEIYNPYSIINVLGSRKYDSYWYASGTPTFLIELLKNSQMIPETLEECKAVADDFNTAVETLTDPIPVLYQSGYLTIKNYRNGIYTLGYPNDEVRLGFVRSLIPSITGITAQKSNMSIIAMSEALETGDAETCMRQMRSFVASVPYEKKSDNESRAEIIFYMIFTLLGQFTQTQIPTAIGRADVVVMNKQYIYIFEIKVHGTVDDALEQIERQHYAVPYETDTRQVVRIGVTYDAQTRSITDWKIEKQGA
jgi:AcrR family transcriptional regulator